MPTQQQIDAALAKARAAGDEAAAAEIGAMTADAPSAPSTPAPPPMPEAQVRAALSRAEAAGDDEAAKEIRALLPSPPPEPEKKPGFFDGSLRALGDGAKAAAQGLTVFGPWTDEAYGYGASVFNDKTPEQNRQDYMRPLEEVDPWTRGAIETGAGVISGGALARYGQKLIGAGTDYVWPMLAAPLAGIAEGAGASEGLGRGWNAALGGSVGPLSSGIARLLRRGGTKVADQVARVTGRNTGLGGSSGIRAREEIGNSLSDNSPIYGRPNPNTPLAGQPQAATAAMTVHGAGEGAQGNFIAAINDLSKQAMGEADEALKMVERAAPRTSFGDVRSAGEAYQKMAGIADMSNFDERVVRAQVANSPGVGDATFAKWMKEQPEIAAIMKKIRRDKRFESASDLNGTFVHNVAVALGDKLRRVTGKDSVRAGSLKSLQRRVYDVLEADIPVYKKVREQYADTIGKAKALESGLNLSPARMPNVQKWSAVERAEFARGVAERLQGELTQGGSPVGHKAAIRLLNKYKPALVDTAFDGNAELFDAWSKKMDGALRKIEGLSLAGAGKKFVGQSGGGPSMVPPISGSPLGALQRALIAGAVFVGQPQERKIKQSTAAAVGNALAETRPEVIQKIIRQAMNNTKDKATARGAALGGMTAGALAATRDKEKPEYTKWLR